MPGSGDRTLITAAGDSEIRIFDIEYAGGSSRGYFHNGARYLGTGDTNARVYRSHSDRVKRLVTESSPYLFLSCSEDGEVRQWDLRLPSSAYPRARGGRGWRSTALDDDTGVPPPLISYKQHHLDLNTISCSPSQPHYIALGGAHLHCFLHDRRMLGRDKTIERGESVSSSGYSEHNDNLMGEATQCVRRFAPNGQIKMKRTDNGHITACKISDANPNEIIVSWSGEYIYSFDLLRSPDARDELHEASTTASKRHRRNMGPIQSRDRKRKRKRKRTTERSSAPAHNATKATSRPRRSPTVESGDGPVVLTVRYGNGQSESIQLQNDQMEAASDDGLTVASPEALDFSKHCGNTTVEIRKQMFTPAIDDNASQTKPFQLALELSASILPAMDDVEGRWRYPLDPSEEDVVLQRTLRRNRQSARRFVQASGTVARLLSGSSRGHVSGAEPPVGLIHFTSIVPAPSEIDIGKPSEQFSYDFIKAIVLWLDSGPGALIEGFTHPPGQYRHSSRFPIPQGASIEAIDELLIPYLLRLAGTQPICNIDTSRFELNANRQIFESEKAAVIAFAGAVKLPFGDLSETATSTTSENFPTIDCRTSQDRKTALKFWGFIVARGLLLNAGDGVNHSFVNLAFGGLGGTEPSILQEEQDLSRLLGCLNDAAEDMTPMADPETVATGEAQSDDENGVNDESEDERDDDADDHDHDHEDDDDDDDEDDDDDDDDEPDGIRYVHNSLYPSSFERVTNREKAQIHVPCSPHIRRYAGHCNLQTVKDVNYFGLDDDYVVSGSDSGHVFIWDKKTSELVNILEGDGDIVNVVQGHPYEPLLAVSGIDHTIKIFSPDARARRNARRGMGISAAAETAGFSSVRTPFGIRRRHRRPANPPSQSANQQVTSTSDEPTAPTISADVDSEEDENDGSEIGPQPTDTHYPNGLASRRRMHLAYQIMAQNDSDRQGGNRSAFIPQDILRLFFQAMSVPHRQAED